MKLPLLLRRTHASEVERWRQQADVSEQFADSWQELAAERALVIEEKDAQIAELRAVIRGECR